MGDSQLVAENGSQRAQCHPHGVVLAQIDPRAIDRRRGEFHVRVAVVDVIVPSCRVQRVPQVELRRSVRAVQAADTERPDEVRELRRTVGDPYTLSGEGRIDFENRRREFVLAQVVAAPAGERHSSFGLRVAKSARTPAWSTSTVRISVPWSPGFDGPPLPRARPAAAVISKNREKRTPRTRWCMVERAAEFYRLPDHRRETSNLTRSFLTRPGAGRMFSAVSSGASVTRSTPPVPVHAATQERELPSL